MNDQQHQEQEQEQQQQRLHQQYKYQQQQQQQQHHHHHDNDNDNIKGRDYLISKEPEFLYGSLLLLSLFPPFAIILIFGGRPSILALCFGSLTTYIFDLLGTTEGTLFSISITLITIWGTLLYASRMLLFDSYLNFAILIMQFIILFYIFIIISSFFRRYHYHYYFL